MLLVWFLSSRTYTNIRLRSVGCKMYNCIIILGMLYQNIHVFAKEGSLEGFGREKILHKTKKCSFKWPPNSFQIRNIEGDSWAFQQIEKLRLFSVAWEVFHLVVISTIAATAHSYNDSPQTESWSMYHCWYFLTQTVSGDAITVAGAMPPSCEH